MHIKLIDDAWFFAKRLWAVRAALFGTAWATAAGLWLALPVEWKPTISEPMRWVLMVVGMLIASAPGFAAVLHQPKLAAEVRERDDVRASDVKVPPPAAPLDGSP